MIIGISGKINSGKDLTAEIIRESFPEYNWKIVKFADKLKDVVCILIGCTREQLEDREFKERELGKEWQYWTHPYCSGNKFLSRESCEYSLKLYYERTGRHSVSLQEVLKNDIQFSTLTPRLILQLLGTECGRQIIHPNTWVSATMRDYIPLGVSKEHWNRTKGLYKNNIPYPNWIISDVRYPNEFEAIKNVGGIVIRLDRLFYSFKYEDDIFKENAHVWSDTLGMMENVMHFKASAMTKEEAKQRFIKEHFSQHESETALDIANFDHTIFNDGTIEDLRENVKKILKYEGF